MAKKHGHNQETGKQLGWNVKESTILPETNNTSRVDLDPTKFSILLEQKGMRVKVYRSSYCPRVKSVDSAEHEIDCTLCNGSAIVDMYPICTKSFMQSQDLEKMQNVEGFVDGNHITMTFPIGIELQYFTLVELEDFTDIFMERVKRKVGTQVDILKYNACRVNFILDYNNQAYYEGTDFKVNSDGNIEWMGNKPADDVIYTLNYEAAVQFRAVRALHVNRFTQVADGSSVEHIKLPEQWIMAKEFLVKRVDGNGVEMKQGPYDNHTIVVD